MPPAVALCNLTFCKVEQRATARVELAPLFRPHRVPCDKALRHAPLDHVKKRRLHRVELPSLLRPHKRPRTIALGHAAFDHIHESLLHSVELPSLFAPHRMPAAVALTEVALHHVDQRSSRAVALKSQQRRNHWYTVSQQHGACAEQKRKGSTAAAMLRALQLSG